MGNVQPWIPDIQRAAAKYGVPADLLAAQLKQESGFDPSIRSPAGAVGIAQFMPGTAKGFGINPLNPHQSIDAQAKYMSQLYGSFHNWDLALAGYNAGGGAVSKYHGIPPYAETRNYVKSINAMRSQFPGLAGQHAANMTSTTTPKSAVGSVGTTQPGGDPVQSAQSGLLGFLLAGAAMPQFNTPQQFLSMLSQPPAAATTTGAPSPSTTAAGPQTGSQVPQNRSWAYPLGKQGKIIQGPYQVDGTHGKKFNQRGGSDNWESENAVDIAAPAGTPVYAVSDGTIGSQIGSLGSGGRFAGLRVHLQTGDNEFYYAHLSRLAVKAGQKVKKGQLLGFSGSANGVAHLHFASSKGNPQKII